MALVALAALGEKEKIEYTRRAGTFSTAANQTPYAPGPRRKVMDEIRGFDAEVLQTSPSKEDETKLKAAFGAEE